MLKENKSKQMVKLELHTKEKFSMMKTVKGWKMPLMMTFLRVVRMMTIVMKILK